MGAAVAAGAGLVAKPGADAKGEGGTLSSEAPEAGWFARPSSTWSYGLWGPRSRGCWSEEPNG